jgi:rubrerythrin
MKSQTAGVLELMKRHELVIKQLYEFFAEYFPQKKDFWLKIASEEQRHANFLQTLEAKESHITWFMENSHLSAPAIQFSIDFVVQERERMNVSGTTLLKAYAFSKDIEDALLEKYLSKINVNVPSEIAQVVAVLAADTKRHAQEMNTALLAERAHLRVGL